MSSACRSQDIIKVSLLVKAEALDKFTTLLQSGIFISAKQGETIGGLLSALPGFTEGYITERIQTIFLDGLPADDLDQELSGTEVVLAISAAMPGLAGAIFRKDGVHAHLRTATEKKEETAPTDGPVTVRLKLFNMIAKERGEALLRESCLIQASALEKFLAYRPPLAAGIVTVQINDQPTTRDNIQKIVANEKFIQLTIRSSRDN